MTYLIIAIILFSFNNVLWKKNLANISVGLLMTYRSFFTSILSVSILFYFYDVTAFSFIQISRTFTAAILGVIGLYSMLTIYKKASIQWAAIYNLLGIIFTILYVCFFKELDVKSSLIGIFIIAAGFIFYIYTNKNSSLKINVKQHLLLILMTLCFGTATILNWENLNQQIPAIFIIANQEVLVFICGTTLLFLQKKIKKLEKKNMKLDFKKKKLKSVNAMHVWISLYPILVTTKSLKMQLLRVEAGTPVEAIIFTPSKIKRGIWLFIKGGRMKVNQRMIFHSIGSASKRLNWTRSCCLKFFLRVFFSFYSVLIYSGRWTSITQKLAPLHG